ncbi:hypothetical protein O7621_28480 [Solwaraspora sp. WMMD937]|uniref:hypothetical protein n=1 Tax=Solwaraspora sp. WMMD937 TaxID=3016090 RepID=UPI00249BDC0E|nr:hypothetical protein [Solwaraspora sp. WMMD937]WFE21706.1 hypothetical protein O7621_28480 [Solwaraspora sp. WMMD937]
MLEVVVRGAGVRQRVGASELGDESWGSYIGVSLRELITTGVGRPNTKAAGGEFYRTPAVAMISVPVVGEASRPA